VRVAGSSQDDDEQDDNFPLPPHLAESSKRCAVADGRRPARKVHIQYDRDNSVASSRLQVAIVKPNFVHTCITRI